MNKPDSLDPLPEEILERLAQYAEGAEIVLGGYFALQHYSDYRTTRDIHAWWRTYPSRAAEEAIRRVMADVARQHGFVLRERRFGDTVSIEFLQGEAKHFSFQIALRSVSLDEPRVSPWPPILIEVCMRTSPQK